MQTIRGLAGFVMLTAGAAFAGPVAAQNCAVTQALCQLVPPGDERELCEAAADYTDPKLHNACEAAIELARDFANPKGNSGSDQTRSGKGRLAGSIYGVYSTTLGRSVNVCVASAPGATGIAMNCAGRAGASVGEIAAGANLSGDNPCLYASATFFHAGVPLPAPVPPPETAEIEDVCLNF